MINLVLKCVFVSVYVYVYVCVWNDFFQPLNYYQINEFIIRLRYSHDLFIKDYEYIIGIYWKFKKKLTKAV